LIWTGLGEQPLLRLNKVLRVARLYKVIGVLRRSKQMQRRIDPALMRLFELIIFLVLAWHYIGCFWWYVGDMCQRSAEERLRVLDANLFTSPETSQHDASSLTMQYLASVYWAVMMSTGLNVAIGPGMRAGQIAYECVITFFGVCLQAYMLGTAASEIANMDAQDTARRQKLKTIKQHLRALRVPLFLRVPIMEYYERETTMSESRESDVIKDMPPSLKVQLAVTLNADFLRSVSFFANLDGVISAALVMCMRSRVCLPAEIVIMQGDVTRVLYFVRSGSCQILKQEGPVGLPTEEDDETDPLGTLVHTLREHSCFGEQSFMTQQPAMASVRSVGYATLMCIFKADFDMIVTMFPQLRVHMLGVQHQQLKEYKVAATANAKRSGCWAKLRTARKGVQRMSTFANPKCKRLSCSTASAAKVSPFGGRTSEMAKCTTSATGR